MAENVNLSFESLPVGKGQRLFGGFDIFFLVAAMVIVNTTILIGGYVGPNMGVLPSLGILILGTMPIAFLVCLMALVNARHGVDTYYAFKAPFGIRGAWIAPIIVTVSLWGWTGVSVFMNHASWEQLNIAFTGSPGSYGVGLFMGVLFAVIIPVVLVLIGPLAFKWVSRVGVTIMIALSALILGATMFNFGWGELTAIPAIGFMSTMSTFDMVVAYTISWIPFFGAFTRFAKGERSAFWGTFMAVGVVMILVYWVGALAGAATGDWDPTKWMIPLGLSWAPLVLIFVGNITTFTLAYYQCTIALKSLSPRFSFRGALAIVALPGVLSVFIPALYTRYDLFMMFIGATYGPLFAVLLVDYFLVRRRRLIIEDLYDSSNKSEYWFSGGVNALSIVSFLIGVGVYFYLFFTGGMDIASATLPSMVAAGLVYWLFAEFLLKRKNWGYAKTNALLGE